MKWTLILGACLLLPACATLDEDDCRQGDWFAIGRQDGVAGRKAGFLREHAKACADYGVKPDQSLWLKGRAAGLPQYCAPDRAFREGRRGKHLSPVCPIAQQDQLERANARGLRLNRIELEIRQIEGDIRAINAELSRLPADDPSRGSLASERSFLRLDLLTLRTERSRLL